jgi:hypothetical protein
LFRVPLEPTSEKQARLDQKIFFNQKCHFEVSILSLKDQSFCHRSALASFGKKPSPIPQRTFVCQKCQLEASTRQLKVPPFVTLSPVAGAPSIVDVAVIPEAES